LFLKLWKKGGTMGSILAGLTFGISGAFMLNYLDTGKIYKILPGHQLRFWNVAIGSGLLGFTIGLLMFLP
jgi:hypothetical protein